PRVEEQMLDRGILAEGHPGAVRLVIMDEAAGKGMLGDEIGEKLGDLDDPALLAGGRGHPRFLVHASLSCSFGAASLRLPGQSVAHSPAAVSMAVCRGRERLS